MEDIQQKLRAFITDNYLFGRSDERMCDDDSLIENGIIDSIGVLRLVVFLERDCGVHVQDDEIVPDNLDSLNKLAAFARRKLNHAGETTSAEHDVQSPLASVPA